ncbi:MlaA family lipoprotein [Virgifigura deserti]|uniref:MlaA family lipoprotein n=1 Tax=Virgifigura deserti TaxID=2268457 RepID=UPI003CCB937E
MSLRRSFDIACVCLAAMLAAGCATKPVDPELQAAYEEANDPLEPMNRYFFEVNYALDELLLKPAAGWYYTALPNPVQDGIRNFLRNLRSPVILANDLFQGEMDRAGDTIGRFAINSTIGLLGLFDVAAELGMPFHDEDFGQTLAVASVGEGPYLVIPLLGPSNPRDLTGRIVDFLIDPLDYLVQDDAFSYGRGATEGIDTRARNLKTLDEIRASSIDYYATMRSLYRQRRNAEIRNGQSDSDAFPGVTFEEDFDFEAN